MMLEIACFNPASAVLAFNAGANRIEFCANYVTGGLTPGLEDFMELRKKVSVPIFIMLHPRPGFYSYNKREFETMKNQISSFKRAKVDGFVFACMYNKQEINITQNKELVQMCAPLPCTFHRAFDEIDNKESAVEDIIRCGFKRILTSGKPGKAEDNLELLENLAKKYGEEIIIMPGGGIRHEQVEKFTASGLFPEIHSAAIKEGERADPAEIKNMMALLG